MFVEKEKKEKRNPFMKVIDDWSTFVSISIKFYKTHLFNPIIKSEIQNF